MIVLYLLLSHLLLSQSGQDTSRLPSYYASLADIPYHVLIVYDNLYCSGGLIRSKIVITAASCLVMAESSTVIVKVGAQVTTDFSQVIEVIEVKKHEYYGVRSEIDNDIALLMLKEHVNFNSLVSKVIISDEMIRIGVGAPVNVSGWGTGTASTDVKYLNKLLNSEMVIVSNPECEHQYLKLKNKANFCVRYQVNQFLSDNGGPAVYHNYLTGILSYGADKNKDPYLALITNVSYFHNWIQLNVDRLMKKYCVISVEDEDYYYESYSAYSSDEY